MRKIEQQMVNAIKAGVDWYKDNTQVLGRGAGISPVYLHGHHLGNYHHNIGQFSVNLETLKAYPTNTTKSRLRALGVNVYTRKGVTYLNDKPLTNG